MYYYGETFHSVCLVPVSTLIFSSKKVPTGTIACEALDVQLYLPVVG